MPYQNSTVAIAIIKIYAEQTYKIVYKFDFG